MRGLAVLKRNVEFTNRLGIITANKMLVAVVNPVNISGGPPGEAVEAQQT
jgi:hypothetical protein